MTQPFVNEFNLLNVLKNIEEMKKIVFGLFIAMVLMFSACNSDDDYSLNDQWIGFGMVVGEEPGAYQIIMDNKDVLEPIAANYPGWQEDFENGDRALINYTILGDDLNDDGTVKSYFVKVNHIEDVLMKGVWDITDENADSLGYDPIIVEKFWKTDSLLNFKLKYWGYSGIHFLNLVKEPGDLTEDSQPIQLEIRHNANEDDESIPYTAFVSFSLNKLRIAELDSVQYEFSWTDYDGVTHSELDVFNYENLELPTAK